MSKQQTPPIVCDMTDAPDTAAERLAEYHHLFATALVGRERTDAGIRFRLRSGPGRLDQVRNLTAREKACCAFMDFDVTEVGDEIWWESSVVDDPVARQILDELYRLPDGAEEHPETVYQRFVDKGLVFVINDDGHPRPASTTDLGLNR